MRRVLESSIAIASGLMFFASTAQAATFLINAPTADASADGLCSLAEAIDNANDDAVTHVDCPMGNATDTIVLSGDVLLTGDTVFLSDGTNGLPSITSSIHIIGNSFSLGRDAAAPSFRLFHIAASGVLRIEQLRLYGGSISSGFDRGAGIYNLGSLSLQESLLENNENTAIFASGGGIYNQGNLQIANTSIRNNHVASANFASGGGIFNTQEGVVELLNVDLSQNTSTELGGAVWNAGSLLVQNSLFEENASNLGGALLLFDAGLPVDPPVRIYNSRFVNNTATGGGGALLSAHDDSLIVGSYFTGNVAEAQAGGAILNSNGILSISFSTFDGNSVRATGSGGAIANTGLGVVNLDGSIIENNQSESEGGGLYTILAPFSVRDSLIRGNTASLGAGFSQAASNVDGFTIERSAIVGNSASRFGGGGYAQGSSNRALLINSTVSGNSATTAGGGLALNAGGRIDLLHVAVVENTSTQFTNSVGGFSAFAGTTEIGSSILADNQQVDCSATNSSTSLDYNISTGPSDPARTRWCSFIPIQANDQTDTDPLLEPLAFNGSLAPSHLLGSASPARNAIPTDCPAGLLGVDQRGLSRSSGSCDVGPLSREAAVLPQVYFSNATSVLNNEATAVGPHIVELVLDNTNGSLTAPGLDLMIHVAVHGSAAQTLDYTSNLTVPSIYTFTSANWPAPGEREVIALEFSPNDDPFVEGNETVALSLSLTGPAILGAQRDHLLTIIDDEQQAFSCSGFLPPFNRPRNLRQSKATIPVKLQLFTADGELLSDSDLTAPPEITVSFNSSVFGDRGDDFALKPLGRANRENQFSYDREGMQWIYRLSSAQFAEPGIYTVRVRSGDLTEYRIENTAATECVQTFVRE